MRATELRQAPAGTKSPAKTALQGSVGEYLTYLIPGLTPKGPMPNWPPDVFAIAASTLQRSGAYPRIVKKWPLEGTLDEWCKSVSDLGRAWRDSWNRKGEDSVPPPQVRKKWAKVVAAWSTKLDELNPRFDAAAYEDPACHALLELLAIADEACRFVGFPSQPGRHEEFISRATQYLLESDNATLCRRIPRSKIAVLPKCHTPQTGLTIRSLTHNIALCPTSEMRPVWLSLPSDRMARVENGLKLLLIPWPFKLSAQSFRTATVSQYYMPDRYGFFTYHPGASQSTNKALVGMVDRLIRRAVQSYGRVDGLIFPELALTKQQYEDVRAIVAPSGPEDSEVRFLLSGTGEAAQDGLPGQNRLRFDLITATTQLATFHQRKHHRWQIDRYQMDRYSLAHSFDREKLYWECTDIGYRDLNILALNPLFTMAVLICEDLARPDPVGDLVRAIGPNLLIALLADAPQILQRWPGRYAAAFADDPGCSVLTLTSLGMSTLDNRAKAKTARTIGLWAEPGNRPHEIALPHGAEGVLLDLKIQCTEEYAADGRGDGGTAGRVHLNEVYPVSRS
jgi:predicted amidohydrolase